MNTQTSSNRVQKLDIESTSMDEWLVLLRKHADEKQKALDDKTRKLGEEHDAMRHQKQLELASRVQIPLFTNALARGEDKRAVPDVFVRSSIFSSCSDQSRVMYKNYEMVSMPGVRITYTGEQLNQSDLDVWQALTELSDVFHSTNECVTTSYHLLKRIGKSVGKQGYDWLEESLIRLFDSRIMIEISDMRNGEGFVYWGHLVESAAKATKIDPRTGEVKMCAWRLRMNPELKNLFSPGQYTAIYWEVRKFLGRKQLAKWLFDYYSSHKVPYEVYVEYLRNLSGSNDKNLSSFTQKLKKALAAIQEAREHFGQPCSWGITSGRMGKKVFFSWEAKTPSELYFPEA